MCPKLLAESVRYSDRSRVRDGSASRLRDRLCELIRDAHRNISLLNKIHASLNVYAGAHRVCYRRVLRRAERGADGETV